MSYIDLFRKLRDFLRYLFLRSPLLSFQLPSRVLPPNSMAPLFFSPRNKLKIQLRPNSGKISRKSHICYLLKKLMEALQETGWEILSARGRFCAFTFASGRNPSFPSHFAKCLS